jgi:ABC-type transporter Mla subunit MlaD
MRRVAGLAAVLLIMAAGAYALWPRGGEAPVERYELVFDNAFGLVDGGDVRVAGVIAGKTVSFRPTDSRPPKAIVGIELTEPGFGSLRRDARCTVRQQSLIGEYYVDCDPGRGSALPDRGRLPLEQTSSTIPLDLETGIYRLPYRQRLRIIISELGTGLAGRPDDLQKTIHRAVPALRRTDEVLGTLAQQNATLARWTEATDRALAGVTPHRRAVARTFTEAARYAGITGDRRRELADELEQLPRFLTRLRADATRLTQLSRAQTPLADKLRTAAPGLNELFTRLRTFAGQASETMDAVGELSQTGRAAVRATSDDVVELGRATDGLPPLSKSLRQLLQSLDDRGFTVEPDDRAVETAPPAPDKTAVRPERGFTGFEALFNYLFWQTLSQNAFDGVSHVLRTTAFVSPCGTYTTKPSADLIKKCASWLGPNQPGVTTPDVTRGPDDSEQRAQRRRARARRDRKDAVAGERPHDESPARPSGSSPAPSTPASPAPAAPANAVDALRDVIEQIVPPLSPDLPDRDPGSAGLLDYLLG